MHKKQWGESDKPWGGSKAMTNTKQWASTSAKTTPRSIFTATTAGRSIVSYDITQTKHRFTNPIHEALAPTDNVWIGIPHLFLPTFWCPKCEKWTSRPESLHEERARW
jgi:hypothetical protein